MKKDALTTTNLTIKQSKTLNDIEVIEPENKQGDIIPVNINDYNKSCETINLVFNLMK